MSSSSNARPASHAERRTANENGTARPRVPPSQPGGSRSESRQEPRRTQSPQPPPMAQSSTNTHKRMASGSQRNKAVEERRIEKVHVTTRETLTTRTRSPERRPASFAQPQERARPKEASVFNPVDQRPKSSKADAPQSMSTLQYMVLANTSFSTVEPRSIVSSPYNCSISFANIRAASCFPSASISAAQATL
jgi:gamma-tubulin complex component 2